MRTAAITVILGLGTGGVLIGGAVIGFLGVTVVMLGIWAICDRVQTSQNSQEIDKFYDPMLSKHELQGYKTLPHRKRPRFFTKPDSEKTTAANSGHPSLC